MSRAKNHLIQNMREEAQELIGTVNEKNLAKVAKAWMDDVSNSKHRFDVIREHFSDGKKILDMGFGAGTFVYYGLLNNYDVYGIDPEKWKMFFIRMKADEYDYPNKWKNHFIQGIGEELPFLENTFDVVSTYQVLEHVQNVEKCISEMLRVVKPGGIIHIKCPDYRSTYEAHYHIAWLPLFPRSVARIYLKLRRRNPKYLDTLNYTTSSNICKYLKKTLVDKKINLRIINLNKKNFEKGLKKKNLIFLKHFYFIYRFYYIYIKNLFKTEGGVNLLVKILEKDTNY